MAKPIAIAILANGRRASREFETLGSKAAKWGKRVAAAGAVAAVALAKTVVSAASDAQQSIGATEQIYGKYADTVIKRSNQAANAIGLSANEYRELSNVTGAMLKSSGMPLAKVADLTDKLNRRAADMAATFGGTTREAVEAVSSLLRGEADPIERYGVSIKQSDVNARLAAKGLDKLEGSAKKTAEQQARLDLLFGQSKDSAGQFARESNTLAGQQQRLAAKIENTKAKVGAVLLPAVTKLVGYANKHLVPALEDGAKWLERNSDEIAAFGKGIGRHALPPLKTLGELAGKTAKWLAELPAPVKEVGVQAGIAALILPRLTAAAAAAGERSPSPPRRPSSSTPS
ncbi:hypothetical protein [Nocardioides alcanivorans]|uniref:hypothetical protein n=1 Tax=Nocardioides alcanivorans TaxID=2897352 RepID=UPI001F23BABE|nr:hypothetical protein [Nocardioides alcanivorans]